MLGYLPHLLFTAKIALVAGSSQNTGSIKEITSKGGLNFFFILFFMVRESNHSFCLAGPVTVSHTLGPWPKIFFCFVVRKGLGN